MYKVMIVDDMDIARREIKRLKLWGEKSGFIISEEAKNGQEALSKLEKSPVDLVITDIKMPKISGIELLRSIMERGLCFCVVLLSDFSEFSFARQGIILGAFDYLAKPVDEDELDKLLQRAHEFILSKRKEKDRVRKLEETLGEKVEALFQEDYVATLVSLIQDKGDKTLETAERIVGLIGINSNYDLVKVESVLKSGMQKILNELLKKYEWVKKFIDVEELKNMNYIHCKDFEAVKALFSSAIQKILTTLNTLQCGLKENGIALQVCECVLENIDSQVSLKIIADKLFMNKTYISEAFKQKTGVSFIEYSSVVKMERAKILITRENLKAYEIAEKLGFSDVEYFSKIFKKYNGVSPTEFRQRNAKIY